MARFSEFHYSNAFSATTGVGEFIEVALAPGEDPADFTLALYQSDGTVGLVLTLDSVPATSVLGDPNIVTDGNANEIVYVIREEDFNFVITDPDGGGPGATDRNYEAFALLDTSGGPDVNTGAVLVEFFDIGGGTIEIEALDGPAVGETSVNIDLGGVPPTTIGGSIQFNQPTPGLADLEIAALTPGDSGVCFCAGTLIDTPAGRRKVEDLKPGDLVMTVDDGPQPIRWHGVSTVRAEGRMAPVRFEAGVLDIDTPLMVSPQHRMLVANPALELLFGLPEGLVAATHMVNGTTVTRVAGGTVEYHHIMFDRHQLIRANGTVTESFFVTPNGVTMMGDAMRAEFAALFPDLVSGAVPFGPLARASLTGTEAVALFA